MTRSSLVIGGARSGKSTIAESRFPATEPVRYVAPARRDPEDDEWERRIAEHRTRRPAAWTTIESIDLCEHVTSAAPDRPVLVDCLTTWLTRKLDESGVWDLMSDNDQEGLQDARSAILAEIARLATAIRSSAGGLVLVTNEVGTGIVPATQSGRLFRDLMGICNATVAGACDEVTLVVAGCEVPIKSPKETT